MDLIELEQKYPYSVTAISQTLGVRKDSIRRWGRRWLQANANHLVVKIGQSFRFSEQAFAFFKNHMWKAGGMRKAELKLLQPPNAPGMKQ